MSRNTSSARSKACRLSYLRSLAPTRFTSHVSCWEPSKPWRRDKVSGPSAWLWGVTGHWSYYHMLIYIYLHLPFVPFYCWQCLDTFQLEMIRIGLVKKIMHCLASDDDDTRYWATACLKEVVSQGMCMNIRMLNKYGLLPCLSPLRIWLIAIRRRVTYQSLHSLRDAALVSLLWL